MLLYVDDLLITGSYPKAIQKFKTHLSTCFHMKDLDPLKYLLGIEVARNSQGMYLCQRNYVLDFLTDAGLLGTKPLSFPMEQNHQLGKTNGSFLQSPNTYWGYVGRLIYLTITRPYLIYFVQFLAQFMHHPQQEHWHVTVRVLRYLKGSLGQGLLLWSNTYLQHRSYHDLD